MIVMYCKDSVYVLMDGRTGLPVNVYDTYTYLNWGQKVKILGGAPKNAYYHHTKWHYDVIACQIEDNFYVRYFPANNFNFYFHEILEANDELRQAFQEIETRVRSLEEKKRLRNQNAKSGIKERRSYI